MVLSCRFEPGFTENPTGLSSQFAATPNRRFKFHKRRQLFIRVNNETLSFVALRVRMFRLLKEGKTELWPIGVPKSDVSIRRTPTMK